MSLGSSFGNRVLLIINLFPLGISSDMYHQTGSYDANASREAQQRLQNFQGASAISSKLALSSLFSVTLSFHSIVELTTYANVSSVLTLADQSLKIKI